MKAKSFFTLPLLALGLASANAANEPVVLTIDGEPIYKSEFEYVYNKNNSAASVEKKSVEEHIDLFVNYKLKVLNAKEDGFDQQKPYLEEYNQYREQLAFPYFMNTSDVSPLIHEAYDRMQKKVTCGHILVKFNSKDTTPPYLKISKIKKELDNGASFAEVAKKYSDCPSGQDGGNLGDVTCFQMVYPFENVIYSLKPGQTSEAFTTKFGYHIARVFDVKPNVYRKKAKQIFIASDVANGEQKIDSLMALLDKGADFQKLIKENNVGTFASDGTMPWINASGSDLPPEVANAVQNLEKVGDYTKLHSRIGWHIFRLDSTNLDIPYEKIEEEIRQQILHSDRINRANELFIKGLYERYNVTVDSASLKEFEALALERDDLDVNAEYPRMNKPLFSFLDETFPQSDFIPMFDNERKTWNSVMAGQASQKLAKAYRNQKTAGEFVGVCFAKYLYSLVLEKSYKQLEMSEPEYRNLLNEYSDGLLLFNVSSAKVWDVASKDVNGLTEYFNANAEKYKWAEPRFRGSVIYCSSAKVKKKVIKFCEKHKDLKKGDLRKALYNEFNKDKEYSVTFKSGTYQKGSNKAVDFYIFKEGEVYESERKSMPEAYVFGELTTQPAAYTDVRGAVVADYQNKLEEDWVKQLRKEHKVKIDYDVLKTIK